MGYINRLFFILILQVILVPICDAHLCEDSGTAINIHFPSTLIISPTATTGSLLTPFVSAEGRLHWQCRYASEAQGIALLFHALHSASSASKKIVIEGEKYTAFATNIAGIAIVLRLQKQAAVYQHYEQTQTINIHHQQQLLGHIHHGPISEMPHHSIAVNTDLMVDHIEAALVKTNDFSIKPGVISSGIIGHIGVANTHDMHYSGLLAQTHAIHFNAVHIVVPTCLTSDVLVQLPKQKISDFKGRHVATGAWMPFAIPLKRCPSTMQKIRYRLLRPNSGFINEQQLIIRPVTTEATAKGVGLQIGDRRHQLIQYGRDLTAHKHSDSQLFEIPLFVRYIKPANAMVTPGVINASVLFELNYD